jgi:UDP-N-acetylglucosamine 4,6-dehydratase
MITSSDSFTTYDLGKYYVILPQTTFWNLSEFIEKHHAKKVEEGFNYNSGENEDFLSISDLKELINKNIK